MKLHEFKMGDVEDPYLYADLEILRLTKENDWPESLEYSLIQENGIWKVIVEDNSEDKNLKNIIKDFCTNYMDITNDNLNRQIDNFLKVKGYNK